MIVKNSSLRVKLTQLVTALRHLLFDDIFYSLSVSSFTSAIAVKHSIRQTAGLQHKAKFAYAWVQMCL